MGSRHDTGYAETRCAAAGAEVTTGLYRYPPHGAACVRKQGADQTAKHCNRQQGAGAGVGTSFHQRPAPDDPLRELLHDEGIGTGRKGCRPPKGGEGISVRFDEHEAIARAYAFFLDGDGEGFGADVGAGYVGREIDDGVFLGVDKEVLSLVSERPPNAFARRRRINELFAMLEDKAQFYAARRDRDASPGPDGLLLIDRRPRFRSRS